MFQPSKIEENVVLTFNQKEITAQIKADVEKQGYTITNTQWDESNKKFTIQASKPAEIKMKGGK